MMDSPRFDEMTKAASAGATRRRVLRGLATGVAGGALVLLGLGETVAQRPDNPGEGRGTGGTGRGRTRVGVCHYDGESGTYTYLRLPEPAARAHARHGDATSVDLATDATNCGTCGTVCGAPDACTPASCANGQCATASACGEGQTCNAEGICETTTPTELLPAA